MAALPPPMPSSTDTSLPPMPSSADASLPPPMPNAPTPTEFQPGLLGGIKSLVAGGIEGATATAQDLRAMEPHWLQKDLPEPSETAFQAQTRAAHAAHPYAEDIGTMLGSLLDPAAWLVGGKAYGAAKDALKGVRFFRDVKDARGLTRILPLAARESAAGAAAGGAYGAVSSMPGHHLEGAESGAEIGGAAGATIPVVGMFFKPVLQDVTRLLSEGPKGQTESATRQFLHKIVKAVHDPSEQEKAQKAAVGAHVESMKHTFYKGVGETQAGALEFRNALHDYIAQNLSLDEAKQVRDAMDIPEITPETAPQILAKLGGPDTKLGKAALPLIKAVVDNPDVFHGQMPRYVKGKAGVLTRLARSWGGRIGLRDFFSGRGTTGEKERVYKRLIPLDDETKPVDVARKPQPGGSRKLRNRHYLNTVLNTDHSFHTHEMTGLKLRDKVLSVYKPALARARTRVKAQMGMQIAPADQDALIEMLERADAMKRTGSRAALTKLHRMIGQRFERMGIHSTLQRRIERGVEHYRAIHQQAQNAIDSTAHIGDDQIVHVQVNRKGLPARIYREADIPMNEVEQKTKDQYLADPAAAMALRVMENTGKAAYTAVKEHFRQELGIPDPAVQVQRGETAFEEAAAEPQPDGGLSMAIAKIDVERGTIPRPPGYKTNGMFPDYYLPKKIANIVDHVHRELVTGRTRLPVLKQLNEANLALMFRAPVVGGWWHQANIYTVYATQYGTDIATNPTRMSAHWRKAVEQVNTFGPDYMRALREGVALRKAMMSNNLIYRDLSTHLKEEMRLQPTAFERIENAMGITTHEFREALSQMGDKAELSMWGSNDTAMLAAIYHHMDEDGMSFEAAAREAEGNLLTYRLPIEHAITRWLSHPDISWFASYHYDLWRIMGRALKRTLGAPDTKNPELEAFKKRYGVPSVSHQDRIRGIRQVAGIVVGSTLVSTLSTLAALTVPHPKGMTWAINSFGTTEIPLTLFRVMAGEEQWPSILHRVLTIPPATQQVLQAFTGGLPKGATPAQVAEQIVGSPLGVAYLPKGLSLQQYVGIKMASYLGLLSQTFHPPKTELDKMRRAMRKYLKPLRQQMAQDKKAMQEQQWEAHKRWEAEHPLDAVEQFFQRHGL